jgi:6-phosphogluconate dehydrogenase
MEFYMYKKADIGLIGLAVMGQNLVLNMNDHGYTVAVYNRTVSKVDDFLNEAAAGRDSILGAKSLEEFVSLLQRPRKIMLMVKAGEVVDKFINSILPLLEEGDIIIDGGNSLFTDTNRRCKDLEAKGILFVGSGVSGGEEGARRGPSLMPGGNKEAWPHIKPIFQAISAKTDNGTPCCDWVGDAGAGHFVKMVHNGIEYGDMQLIAEAYNLMKDGLGLNHDDMYQVLDKWNKGSLDSYLIEITRDIMGYREEGEPLVEKILDKAGQKGTGKWTGISSLELGMPVTLIGEAVFARCLSALKDERVEASKLIKKQKGALTIDNKDAFIDDLEKALLASKIISYAQGFMLMREAAKEYSWTLNYGAIALMWRGGCIIRSAFLDKINLAYEKNPELKNLILDPYFAGILENAQKSWRNVASQALSAAIPLPTMTSALSFFDGYTSAVVPANLLQAQRDYFGAHTYRRIDRPEEESFHTNWTGRGGDVSAGKYDV